MSVAALDPRDRLYAGLRSRNRAVAVLRWAVPGLGVVLLLVLIGQVMLRSLAEQYGVSNINIDRDNLVVETPRMNGTWGNGASYTVEARLARAALDNTSVVTLEDARFRLSQAGGDTLSASAAAAEVELGSQQVRIAGTTMVSSSTGLNGTLGGVVGDIPGQKLAATGGVELRLPDGTALSAQAMQYDIKARQWIFSGAVSVTLPLTPGDRP